MMVVKKCNICGAEMHMIAPRYKVIFNGFFYVKEKDVCMDCFNRIADEINQFDSALMSAKLKTKMKGETK